MPSEDKHTISVSHLLLVFPQIFSLYIGYGFVYFDRELIQKIILPGKDEFCRSKKYLKCKDLIL